MAKKKKRLKARMGRPEKPDAERLDDMIIVRLRGVEKQAVEDAAKAADVKSSAWIRAALLKALEADTVEKAEGVGVEPQR